MKSFLVTFLISTAATICLWQFGLGRIMWPAHPFIAALITAIACGIVAQILFSRDSAGQAPKKTL